MSELPWIKTYPPAVRWDIPLTPKPVHQLLAEAVAQWPDHPAIDYLGGKLSYRRLQALVHRAAKGLQALGVKPGVHVGLYLPNTPHYIIGFMAVLKAGGTVVNYSPLDAERVLEHKVEDSETDFIITLDAQALYPQMARLLGRSRLQKLIVGSASEFAADPDAVRAALARSGQVAEVADDDRHLSFAQLLDNDGAYQPYPVQDPTETIAVLQYTGGTTGLPKGAMLTHGNLSTACQQLFEALFAEGRVELGKERVLAVLPPFHIYSITVNMLYGLRSGAELYLHTKFDPEAALETISSARITSFPGVPTMYTALLNHPRLRDYDLSSLKFCNSGGAPLPLDVQRQFEQSSGCRLGEGWGMTETSATGTILPLERRKAGSCGLPIVGATIRIADLADPAKTVPLGERGEICIRGPNIMKAYWKKPQATADSMTPDGFFRTGDVGVMDEDGFVYIVDRTKDMILCSGFNVYPRVIEEAIYEHPAVSEVSVIGVADPYRGQSPKAFVKLKDGAAPFSLEELQGFLRDKLGKHEMVRELEIRDALPKTPVGKLSKKELYEEESQRRAAQPAAGA
jgi:long-chain acyl-CoA synthetase